MMGSVAGGLPMDHGAPMASSSSGAEVRAFAATPGGGESSGVSQPTYGQVYTALKTYVNSGKVESVCHLKNAFPGYRPVIDELKDDEKLLDGGFRICFPTATVWESRPEVREKIVSIFREHGVL